MSNGFQMRQSSQINYKLSKERFDEYVFCDKCTDYVYEYCSIHGPLLIIPDNKISSKSDFPPYVPGAALSIPHKFLHLAVSSIPGAGLGVFSSLTLPCGVRFGPYHGKNTLQVDSMYCWELRANDNEPQIISASDGNSSNWMRYVNCARHYEEQNLLAYQYKGKIYYRTIKVIPKLTELLIFYGSEYAATLQIDLRKYNSKRYYHEVIGAHEATDEHKRKKLDNLQTSKGTTTQEIDISLNGIAKHTNNIITKEESAIIPEDTQSMIFLNKPLVSKDSPFIFDNEPYENRCSIQSYIENEYKRSKTAINNQQVAFTYEFLHRPLTETDNQREIGIDNTELGYGFKLEINNDMDINSYDYNSNYDRRFADSNKQKEVSNNFNSIETYDKHFTEVNTKWRCNYCHSTIKKKSMLGHIKLHNINLKYNCPYCRYKTDVKYKFDRHISEHTGIYEFNCTVCTYSSNSKEQFKRHISNLHDFLLKCEFCDFKNANKSKMAVHRSMHGKENVFKCSLCDYLTPKNYTLQSHMLNMHNK